MSGDLASFVAATLRDKVIHELQDEIRLLNVKSKHFQKIEILSSCYAQCEDQCEVTTYAIGYLEDGSYLPERKLGIVPLKSIGSYNNNYCCDNNDYNNSSCNDRNNNYNYNYNLCPLKQFHRLRVCIGGLHKTYLSLQNDSDSDIDRVRDSDHDRDSDNDHYRDDDVYNGVNCQFTGTGDTENSVGLAAKWGDIWIEFIIHNWPKQHYTTIIQKERNGGGGGVDDNDQIINLDGESISLLNYLKSVLPQLYPKTCVEFIFIALASYENSTIIKNFMLTASNSSSK